MHASWPGMMRTPRGHREVDVDVVILGVERLLDERLIDSARGELGAVSGLTVGADMVRAAPCCLKHDEHFSVHAVSNDCAPLAVDLDPVLVLHQHVGGTWLARHEQVLRDGDAVRLQERVDLAPIHQVFLPLEVVD
jgi:hypothetical protein